MSPLSIRSLLALLSQRPVDLQVVGRHRVSKTFSTIYKSNNTDEDTLIHYAYLKMPEELKLLN